MIIDASTIAAALTTGLLPNYDTTSFILHWFTSGPCFSPLNCGWTGGGSDAPFRGKMTLKLSLLF